jgi:hypothetical protein
MYPSKGVEHSFLSQGQRRVVVEYSFIGSHTTSSRVDGLVTDEQHRGKE